MINMAAMVVSYNVEHSKELLKDLTDCEFLSFAHWGLKPVSEDAENRIEKTPLQSTEEKVQNEDETIPVTPILNRSNKNSDWGNVPKDHPIIYMKMLDPDLCIGFNTEQGKQIFKRAIQEDYMNIYFPLSQHFHTQFHPNYCAAGTLVVVLNALKVDPRRMWKYPWRWYDEYMLNTCVDLDTMKVSGCDFEALGCIARCNKLSVEAVRVSPETSLADYRNDVKRACSSDDTVMVLNYARGAFNQTGTGHFTPIGGYDEKEDMVLLLDTARFKHPPHWVSLEASYWSMAQFEKSLNGYTEEMPRGYYLMRKNERNPFMRLKFPNHTMLHFEALNPFQKAEIRIFQKIYSMWDTWLDLNIINNVPYDIIQNTVKQMVRISCIVHNYMKIADRKRNTKCVNKPFNIDCSREFISTDVFARVSAILGKLSTSDIDALTSTSAWVNSLFVPSMNDHGTDITGTAIRGLNMIVADFITLIILFWPYRTNFEQPGETHRKRLEALVSQDLKTFSKGFVQTVEQQIRFVSRTLEHFGHEKLHCKQEYYFD